MASKTPTHECELCMDKTPQGHKRQRGTSEKALHKVAFERVSGEEPGRKKVG